MSIVRANNRAPKWCPIYVQTVPNFSKRQMVLEFVLLTFSEHLQALLVSINRMSYFFLIFYFVFLISRSDILRERISFLQLLFDNVWVSCFILLSCTILCIYNQIPCHFLFLYQRLSHTLDRLYHSQTSLVALSTIANSRLVRLLYRITEAHVKEKRKFALSPPLPLPFLAPKAHFARCDIPFLGFILIFL